MTKNVFRKGLVIGIIILFLEASVGASVTTNVGFEKIELELRNLSTSIRQDIIYVNNDYDETTPTWNVTHFDNIQAGVNAVNENGIVYVCNGTYYENVVIDKPLNLIGIDEDYLWGTDSDGSIIDGGGLDNVICIYYAKCVEIIGFHINNSEMCGGSGIYVHYGHDVIIKENIIENCHSGIHLFYTKCLNSQDNIYDNIIRYNYRGVFFHDAIQADIKVNTITNNSFQNIALATSSGCDIVGNTISNGGTGIFIENSGGIDIKGNYFRHNVWVDNDTGIEYNFHADVWNCRNQWASNHWDTYKLEPARILFLNFGWFVIFGRRWWPEKDFWLPILIQIDTTAIKI